MFCITFNWCHFTPRTAAKRQHYNAPVPTDLQYAVHVTVGAAILRNPQSGDPSLICNPVMPHVTAESWLQKEEAHEALKKRSRLDCAPVVDTPDL